MLLELDYSQATMTATAYLEVGVVSNVAYVCLENQVVNQIKANESGKQPVVSYSGAGRAGLSPWIVRYEVSLPLQAVLQLVQGIEQTHTRCPIFFLHHSMG